MSGIGKVFKQKTNKYGTFYISDLFNSMFIVAAENLNNELVFSKTIVYNKSTKTKQRKLANEIFNKVRQGNFEEND